MNCLSISNRRLFMVIIVVDGSPDDTYDQLKYVEHCKVRFGQ